MSLTKEQNFDISRSPRAHNFVLSSGITTMCRSQMNRISIRAANPCTQFRFIEWYKSDVSLSKEQNFDTSRSQRTQVVCGNRGWNKNIKLDAFPADTYCKLWYSQLQGIYKTPPFRQHSRLLEWPRVHDWNPMNSQQTRIPRHYSHVFLHFLKQNRLIRAPQAPPIWRISDFGKSPNTLEGSGGVGPDLIPPGSAGFKIQTD